MRPTYPLQPSTESMNSIKQKPAMPICDTKAL